MMDIRSATFWKTAGAWLLIASLTSFFVLAGGMKLRGAPAQVDNFAHWGYAPWFLYLVGAVEVIGGIGLLIPRMAVFAALLLGGTMLGAALTHLVHNEMMAVPVPLAVLGFLTVAGYIRRGPLVALYERWLDS